MGRAFLVGEAMLAAFHILKAGPRSHSTAILQCVFLRGGCMSAVENHLRGERGWKVLLKEASSAMRRRRQACTTRRVAWRQPLASPPASAGEAARLIFRRGEAPTWAL